MAFMDTIGGRKSSLVLLHPTSLPDPAGAAYGVGELGSEAFQFVDILADSGTLGWQMLPLGHTGYGNSPYQTFSRFAGSPYMISVERLREVGDLATYQHDAYIAHVQSDRVNVRQVDFGWLFRHKLGASFEDNHAVLRQAFIHFEERGPGDFRRQGFEAFCAEHAPWLNDYAEYMALKEIHGHRAWNDWPAPFRKVDEWRSRREQILDGTPPLARSVRFYQYVQFVFFEQWNALRDHVRREGRVLIGDIPWYVGYDSADVWARPGVFDIDDRGIALNVAGVPPDYFSPTGQLWGNPVYNWSSAEAMTWWVDSIAFILGMVDILRIDHFRAIDTYWKVPWEHVLRDQSARNGMWDLGPGRRLFEAIRSRLQADGRLGETGALPIIAEDLGGLDPVYQSPDSYPHGWNEGQRYPVADSFGRRIAERDASLEPGLDRESGEYNPRRAVDRLLGDYGVPWMGVLQFGFQGAERYMPAGLEPDSVLYTGTHDNNTTAGWFCEVEQREREDAAARRKEAEERAKAGEGNGELPDAPVLLSERIGRVLAGVRGGKAAPVDGAEAPHALCEIAWSAPSSLVGTPLQDIIALGDEARMNLPGDASRAWWTWRARREQMEAGALTDFLHGLNERHGRRS